MEFHWEKSVAQVISLIFVIGIPIGILVAIWKTIGYLSSINNTLKRLDDKMDAIMKRDK